MRTKRVAKIIVFCVIFVFLFNNVYRILSWKDTAGEYYSSMESFYDLDKNVVDVLFLGSSHCYCSINNAILWDSYGMGSFSLAISGQDLASTYHCFKEALKTQSPKVVCIELYGVLFDGYAVEGNLYRNTLPFKPSVNAYNAINSMVEEDRMSFLLKWPIIHTRYAELQKEDFQNERPVYLGYHAEYQTQSIGELVPYMGEETIPIGQAREEWILKIIQLAKESDTELCFFLSPSTASEEDQKRYKYVENLAQEYDIPFINFIALKDVLGLDPSKDFIDGMHTNYYGAEKVTAYMGDYLWSNYSLTNHYGDPQYALWEENSKVRQHEADNHAMQYTSAITEYLEKISYIEDYTVMIATSGDYLVENTLIAEWLSDVGIGEEFFETGGFWIVEDSEIVYKTFEKDFLYRLDLGECDLEVRSIDGQRTMIIDLQQRQKVANGINIIVYDKLLGKVIDAVGFTAEQDYACVK